MSRLRSWRSGVVAEGSAVVFDFHIDGTRGGFALVALY